MAIIRNRFEILLISEVASSGQTGRSHRIIPALNSHSDTDISFHAFVHMHMTGGASSPTVTVHLETSPNGTLWCAVGQPVVFDTAGDVCKLVPLETLCSYVRARIVLAGGTLPSYTGDVQLLASHPIKVERI